MIDRVLAVVSGEVITLSAADPLNLTGVVTAGPRVPAVMGHLVRYVDGVPEGATPVVVEEELPS